MAPFKPKFVTVTGVIRMSFNIINTQEQRIPIAWTEKRKKKKKSAEFPSQQKIYMVCLSIYVYICIYIHTLLTVVAYKRQLYLHHLQCTQYTHVHYALTLII